MARARKPRNGLEWQVWNHLTANSADFGYESEVIKYTSRVVKGTCDSCGHNKCSQHRSYTPDFPVTRIDGSKVYLETKGRFPAEDRSKMRDVIKSNPHLDIRMVFSDGGPKRNAVVRAWCDKNGVYCHIGPEVPLEWIQ